ncbi:FAD-dependent oxidoreductase [uncultured Streptomyces sp.]|uniref:FAD-dependent oxidoreductase n=1 Tax=uncultured Streptomyces sp. TaxID=174707 RepID=UPI002633DEED|nr:FAD-dependent oxidoreductase [uncultured Streptomyces sp.]
MRTHAAYDCDVMVIGGGTLGLATARALERAAPGVRVTVLERAAAGAVDRPGPDDGVIACGVRHRPGSFEARTAVRGAAELADFCAEHGIRHTMAGELIVATDRGELPRLHALAQRGRQHRLPVRELGPAQIAEYEPWVRGLAGIRVGGAGTADAGAVRAALAADAVAAGAVVRYGCEVVAVDRRPWGVAVRTADGAVVRARTLVNCAGPHADRVARLTGDRPGIRLVRFREPRFSVGRPELVRGQVHTVPPAGLPGPLGFPAGLRLTRGTDGALHVGAGAPLVPASGTAAPAEHPGAWRTAVRHLRHRTAGTLRPWSDEAFTAALRRLLPDLGEDDLRPSGVAVHTRAMLPDGGLTDGFLVREAPHTVHVLNAPTPVAAVALPLGREVARRALASARGTGWRPPAVESGHCV